MRTIYGYGYIYLILNKVNGKTYIGKKAFDKKLKNQTWQNDKYMGSGKHLRCAKKKYGIENFEKFLICYTDSEEDACEKEKFWIAEYRSKGKAEYNICSGGEFGYKHKIGEGPRRGQHHSEETKRKMSIAHLGKQSYIRTPEINEKIGLAFRGKTWIVGTDGKRHWIENKEIL